MIGNGEMVIRLLVAALLGALIGIEREYRSKVAGLRTHLLVAIGSALFMLLSQYGFGGQGDPARIAAQIVSGIGFIGAGIIFYHKEVVRGLTTAAGIWATAAIGLALGAGMYTVGILVTVLMILLQISLHKFLPADMQSSKELLLVISKDYHTVMPRSAKD